MRHLAVGAAALALLGSIAAAADAARSPARPDLTVARGAVTGADGVLSGSFVVRSARKAAGSSTATLEVRVGGRRKALLRFSVGALGRGVSRTVRVRGPVPAGLPVGPRALLACADATGRIREHSETNNCRTVGRLTVAAATASPAPGAPTPGAPTPGSPTPGSPTPGTPAPPAPTPPPASSVPSNPVPFQKDTVFSLESAETRYWLDVPGSYDASHATPTTLFVWLHGCEGRSEDDIYTVAPSSAQRYIAITVGGAEGGCWNPDADVSKVLAAIASVKTHFNIDPRGVVLGGYSSGGDLTYRAAFYHSTMFAGVLVENSSPFRDTRSSQAASLGAASFKFHVVHLAHRQDDVYPIDGVRSETDAVAAAGFPLVRVERDGTHYDDSDGNSGSDYDLRTYLLPHLADGWQSPGG